MSSGKVLAYNFAIVALFVAFAYFLDRWWLSLIPLLFIVTETVDIIPDEDEVIEDEEDDDVQ